MVGMVDTLGNPADVDAAPAALGGFLAEQLRVVAWLNGLCCPEWTVDAGPVPTYAEVVCSEDWVHGRGTVWFPSAPGDEGREFKGVCPACAHKILSRQLHVGDFVSVDVCR